MRKYKEILAKSDGCTLKEHTIMAVNLGLQAAHSLFRDKEVNCDIENVFKKLSIALILHDIGKCKDKVQKIIKGNKTDEKTEHHIYSWSFFRHYVNGSYMEENEPISCSILYHHPLLEKKDSADYQFTDAELEVMNSFYEEMKHYVSDTFGIYYDNDYSFVNNGISTITTDNEPLYKKIKIDGNIHRNHPTEALKQLFRTCIVFADRIVSSSKYDKERLLANDKEYMMNEIINSIIYGNNDDFKNIDILSLKNENNEPLYDIKRLSKQIKVIDEIESWDVADKNTMVISATAGFGKTMIGVLWALRTKKRTIWVTPRNAIASSTYNSICSELENIGEDKVKVALYYSGEYIKGDKDADILVTNIDSILYRNIKNDKQILLFNVYTNNMIFDEYHEFKCGEPLFSGFIRMMYARKYYTNTKTMMLSATPLNFSCLYGKEFIQDYIPLHLYNDMKVNINVKEYEKLEDFECCKDSFVIVPFVSWAQKLYEPNKGNDIIHARYTETDRAFKERKLTEGYGKKSVVENKTIVFGTNIIGVGLDISAKNIYDFFVTPEDTIQRGCGRSGRFNEKEYQGSVNYNICRIPTELVQKKSAFKDRVNDEINRILYEKWFETIKQYDGKTLTKGDLYELRKNFYNEHRNDMEELYKKLFEDSDESLSEFKITRSPIKNKNRAKAISKENNYRGSDDEIFVTVKDNNGNYIDPICLNMNILKESDDSDDCKIRRDYMLNNENFDKKRMEYVYKLKKPNDFIVDKCSKMAYTNKTPLLLVNASYNSDIGLKIGD